MRQFTYPIKLTADRKDGGFVVTCRDLPEAITQGDSVAALPRKGSVHPRPAGSWTGDPPSETPDAQPETPYLKSEISNLRFQIHNSTGPCRV